MAAAYQPQLEMDDNDRQPFESDGWTCSYCAASMSAASRMCLTCGMPRPVEEDRSRMLVATPSPKLMSAKPYDPYAQFYSSATPEPQPIAPQLKAEEPLPERAIFSASVVGATGSNAANLRPAALVFAAVALLCAVAFCLQTVWTSRSMIAANLDEVRGKLHEMAAPKTLPLPRYTATPISRTDRARWVPAPPAPKQEVAVVQPPPTPHPSGPGTMHVQISQPAPAPGVIAVSLQ